MKNPFNYIIAFLLISLGVVWYSSLPRLGGGLEELITTDQEKIDALPVELKLKADKEKILDSKEVDNITCTDKLNPTSCVNQGKITQYAYISDVEVPQASITADKKTVEEDMTKRTGNAQFFKIKETATGTVYQAKFFVGQPFIKEAERWMQVDFATTTIDSFDMQMKPDLITKIKKLFIGTAEATDYYTNSGDGSINCGPNGSWAGVKALTTGSATSLQLQMAAMKISTNYYLYRSFMAIDTSAIPSGSSITDATLNIYFSYIDGTEEIDVVQTTQASSTSLTNNDFDNVEFTPGASVAPSSIAAYTPFPMNATGKGWIKKSGEASSCGTVAGYTCLGLLSQLDTDNTTPDHRQPDDTAWVSEDAVGKKPYISITYTEGGGVTAPVQNNNIILFE